MQLPLQLTIRDVPHTQALETHIRKKVDKLNHFYERLISCRIVVDTPQKHQHQGKLYNVRLDISVPREELVVNRIKNQDIYVAIRDAFNAAKRKLQSYARKQRGEVKNHIPLVHGKVARLYPEENIGFIESFDGREFYFHSNNVAYPLFDQLSIGQDVQFLEIVANEGYQANRITAGKHKTLSGNEE